MLDACADTSALHPFDHCAAQFTCQIRIFTVILKIPSAKGGPLDIHSRSEDHTDILMLAGIPQAFPDLPEHFPVKACRSGAGGGETDC